MTERRPDDATILAALHESEGRYRFMSETIPVQVWTALPDGRLDYVSEQTARFFGLSAPQLLIDGWQHVLHPDDLPVAIERWTHALTTGETYEIEFRLKDAAGAYAWHLARAVPQRSASGAVVRWFGTNTNIEEQRKHRREVEILAARLREKNHLLALEAEVGFVLTHAGSLADALRTCAEAVVRHVGAAFARIWTTNDAGTVLELQASAGLYTHLDGPHGRVPVGRFEIGQIAAERKPHFTNQVVGDDRIADQEWALREGMVAFVGYPIVFDEKVVGVIAAFAKTPLSAPTVAAVGSLANALAQSLERRRAEEHLARREAWLSTTLSSIGDGVIATDPDGRVTFVNPVAATLTGWAPDEAVATPLDRVFPLVHEDSRATVESPVAKVLREGTIVGMANQTILLRRDGTEVPIDDSAAPIRDRSGALTGVVLVFRDASEKRRIEAERVHLLGQEQRARRDADAARADLHSLFMQAPAPICILRGPEHTFDLVNPRYMQRVGTHRTLLGKPIREALPEIEGQGFFELLDRVYATGERYVGTDLPAKIDRSGDGEPDTTYVTFTYEPFRDVDGNVAGIVIVAFDVTDSVRARESLRANVEERERLLAIAEDAREKADSASRAKDEFLTTASHELRTPLNAILGWARLLRSGSADPSGFIRGLETIERNAKAQVQLIEDILDGSRIITGKLHLEIRSVDLVALVHAAIDTVRPAAAAKNISVAVHIDPDASRILGDPDRLQQVVWNLVNNALKFTPRGGNVAIRVDRVGTSIELAVTDDGKGISGDFLPHVFERFRQGDGSTTRRHGGLGLGLALVRHLAEAHGGGVRAESPGDGLGATFTVTLPVQAIFPETVEAMQALPRPTGDRASPLPNSLHGIRVLVVDDELDARDLVATLLRAQGADVVTASSLDQAIESLTRYSPDVIVSDIGMPNADGYALIGRVRALDTKVSGTPALALTAYAREEDRRRALAAGFQTYLAKPAEPDALIRMVLELAATAPR